MAGQLNPSLYNEEVAQIEDYFVEGHKAHKGEEWTAWLEPDPLTFSTDPHILAGQNME